MASSFDFLSRITKALTISRDTSSDKTPSKINPTAPCYAEMLLHGLCDLWREDLFCDVTITVAGKSFRAHRHVLSAASPYFRAMFSSGMQEQSSSEITLQDTEAHIFETALNFIYSGQVEVTSENCQDLLGVSDMLGLVDVVMACSEFLKTQLQPDNSLGIYLFADAHQCLDVRDEAECYIQGHFMQVSQEEEFLTLPKDVLIHFLSSEKLRVEQELQVFNAAMKWIHHGLAVRKRQVFDVMAPIRFPIIPQQSLDPCIDRCQDISLKIALQKLLQDYKVDRKLYSELKLSRTHPHMLQPRKSARKNIFVIGGYTRGKDSRWSDIETLVSAERYDTFHHLWHGIPCMKNARSGHGVTVLDRKIFVIGGENDALINDSVECYDPAINKWSTLPNLNYPRCGLGVCSFKNYLFAFGGWIGSEIGNTIERYDFQTDAWVIIGQLEVPRFAMGVVEHEGLIYVIGGLSDMGSTELRHMESYNPVTKEWQRLSDMHMSRGYVGVAAIDDHIYAVGGWNENHGSLASVEKYSIENDKWEEVAPMSVRRAGAGVAAVNGQIYAIGGRTYTLDHSAPATLDLMERYSPETDTWVKLTNMTISRCEAGVVVV
ncbi:actin-binding protein IPP-like isoform X3 [Haliotis asinina]|uniref:actin-binding protein IPP-like isoform X1 n=1 Tax=Haliotis asinina TaxID=109174 RepID=UPI00353189F2